MKKQQKRKKKPAEATMKTIRKRVSTRPSRKMETFPNPKKGRDYEIEVAYPEFTCICPMTGQPDFATITVEYIPDQKILESKSFKLYLWSYRDEGAFHEHVANQILDDLVEALEPHWCWVQGAFNTRGGIQISVEAEHGILDEV